MTRINIGIPPASLHNKHLIAEHREIKRIPIGDSFIGIDSKYMNDYLPTSNDISIITQRINEKLKNMKK